MAKKKQVRKPIPAVVLGVPCNKWQIPAMWKSIYGSSTSFMGMVTAGGALTDINRNTIVSWFLLESKAEWLFFLDDDIELPSDAVRMLLDADKPFIAGVYYRRKPPCDPLIYRRESNGWYSAVLPDTDYTPGDIIPIDAAGMGCTLIHRSVFEAVIDSHFLYRRHNGSFGFMPYGNVVEASNHADLKDMHRAVRTMGDTAIYTEVVKPFKMSQLLPNERAPFFALEYGRTEDFHFCELTKTAGVQLWAHTGVECPHWGDAPIGREQFEQVRAWMQAEQMKVAPSPNGDALPFHVEVA